jgi:HAD superfamily hydrolase (TIGR01509 family)
MTLEALIFDVDGTLADTERDGHRVAFNRTFANEGLDWEWSVELYGELLAVTGGKERIRRFIEKYQPDFTPDGELDAFLRKMHLQKNQYYAEMLQQGEIGLRPGVKRILEEARTTGLRLAIATTTSPENVTNLLTYTLGKDAMDWFEVIGAGDIVPAKKPAPDIYDFVLKEMQLDAKYCMAFEDSHNGILSSHGANLPTIITINDYTRDHDFDDALLVVDQFGEPDSPFSVIAGNNFDAHYVDIALIKKLHESAN